VEGKSKQTHDNQTKSIHTIAQTFNEIAGVHFRLPVLEAGQPGGAVMAGAATRDAAAAAAAGAAAAAWTAHPALLVFVEPVGGEAHLGNGVHPDKWVGRKKEM